MTKLFALLCGLVLIAGLAGPGFAFQEYPSLEISPYVGYLAYDSQMTDYASNLAYGIRLDLRTTSLVGFQFHYALSASAGDFPGQPFGQDEYVERIQLNLTRDLFLVSGLFISTYIGGGSFNRHLADLYDTDPSVQAGISARRNLWSDLYLRADFGWTGAFLQDHDSEAQFAERTMTSHYDASLTFSFLLDN